MDKLLSQRLIFQQKRDDAMAKIRELGVLTAEAYNKSAHTQTRA